VLFGKTTNAKDRHMLTWQGWCTTKSFNTDRQTWLRFYNVDAEYPNIARLVYLKSRQTDRQTDIQTYRQTWFYNIDDEQFLDTDCG